MSKMGVLFLAKASSNEYINSQINSLKVEMVRNILQMMRAEELQCGIDNATKREIKDRTRTNDKVIDLKKTGNQDSDKNNSSWPLIDLTRDESDEEVPEGAKRVNLDKYVDVDKTVIERLPEVSQDALEKFYEALPDAEKSKFDQMLASGEIKVVSGPSACHPMRVVVPQKDEPRTYASVITQKPEKDDANATKMTELGRFGARPRVNFGPPKTEVEVHQPTAPSSSLNDISQAPSLFSRPLPTVGDYRTNQAGHREPRKVDTFFDSLNDTPAHNSTSSGPKFTTCTSFSESILGVEPPTPLQISEDNIDPTSKTNPDQKSKEDFGVNEDDDFEEEVNKITYTADQMQELMDGFSMDLKDMRRAHQEEMDHLRHEMLNTMTNLLASGVPPIPPRDETYQNVALNNGVPFVPDDTMAAAARAQEKDEELAAGGGSPILSGSASERYTSAPGAGLPPSVPSDLLQYRTPAKIQSPRKKMIEKLRNKRLAPTPSGDQVAESGAEADATMVSVKETPRTKNMIDAFEQTLNNV